MGALLAESGQCELLFHATFDHTLKARTARQEIEPEESAGEFAAGVIAGGVLISGPAGLRYPSENAIRPDRGSIAFWACPRWNGGDGNHGFFQAEGSGGSGLYIYAFDDGRLVFNVLGPGGSQHYANVNIESGACKFRADEWRHVVCSWKTSPNPRELFYEVYLDGIRVAHGVAVPRMLEEPCEPGDLKPFFLIGTYQKETADAVLDDFRIYDAPLSKAEIQELVGLGRQATAPAGASEELRDGLVNLALVSYGARPVAGSVDTAGAHVVQRLADGDPATFWQSLPGDARTWIEVELPFTEGIEALRLLQQPGDQALRTAGSIKRMRLLGMNRGRWRELRPETRLVPGDARRWMHWPLAGQPELTKLRLEILETEGDQPARLAEFQVRGRPPVVAQQFAPQWLGSYLWVPNAPPAALDKPLTCYARKSFKLDGIDRIKRVRILSYGLSGYAVYFNGSPLDELKPLCMLIRRDALETDVPLELVKTVNCIALQGQQCFGIQERGLLAEVLVERNDGRIDGVAATGPDWKTSAAAPDGLKWTQPDFDDSGWHGAELIGGTAPGAMRAASGIYRNCFYFVEKPCVFPNDELGLRSVTVDGAEPGQVAKFRLVFEVKTKLTKDYAIILWLGKQGACANDSFEVEALLRVPSEARTSAWEPGRQVVRLEARLPAHTANPLPARVQVCCPEGSVRLISTIPTHRTSRYGTVDFEINTNAPVPSQPGRFPAVKVKDAGGTPTLFIDGRAVTPFIYAMMYTSGRKAFLGRQAGAVISRPVVWASPVSPIADEDAYFRTYANLIDEVAKDTLGVHPEAYLMPALWLNPPAQWLFAHADDAMVLGDGTKGVPFLAWQSKSALMEPTFGGASWEAAEERMLRRLVRHIQRQPYAARLVGFHFAMGRAGENYYGYDANLPDGGGMRGRDTFVVGDYSPARRRQFVGWLRQRYGGDAARLRSAWCMPEVDFDELLFPEAWPSRRLNEILVWRNRKPGQLMFRDPFQPGEGLLPVDYWVNHNLQFMSVFQRMAKAVRDESGGRLVTGNYGGYVFPNLMSPGAAHNGHLMVHAVHEDSNLIYSSSPPEYYARTIGTGNLPMHPWDTCRLYGKFWANEYDTRSYRAGVPDGFVSPSPNVERTVERTRWEMGSAMIKGGAYWYLDMSNNWLADGATAVPWHDDPRILRTMRQMKTLYDFSLTLKNRKPSSQIMVLMDPKTVLYQDPLDEAVSLGTTLMHQFRQQVLERIGAPYDSYLTDDLDRLEQKGLLAQYRLIVFFNQFHTTEAERRFIEDRLMRDGRTLFWIYAPGYVRDINVAAHGEPPTGLANANVAELIGARQVNRLSEVHEVALQLADPGKGSGETAAPIPGGRWGPIFWVPEPATTSEPRVTRRAMGWLALDGEADRTKVGLLDVQRTDEDGRLQSRSIYCAIPNFRAALLRRIAREAGVHIYLDADELLFADRNWILLSSGARPLNGTLNLAAKQEVYDVFADAALGASETLPLTMPPFTARLYFLGKSAALQGHLARGK